MAYQIPGAQSIAKASAPGERGPKVTDICNEGDYVTVKVIDIDNSGKIRLSRKAALKELDE